MLSGSELPPQLEVPCFYNRSVLITLHVFLGTSLHVVVTLMLHHRHGISLMMSNAWRYLVATFLVKEFDLFVIFPNVLSFF